MKESIDFSIRAGAVSRRLLPHSLGKHCSWLDLSRDLGVTNTFVSALSALTNLFVEFS